MKILLIEDEPRAARRLQKMVGELLPEATLLGPTDSVLATEAILTENPKLDLIVSDIQLSDGLSFQVFEKREMSCPVIFTTAYDQYAIQAFKVNGIDYLLKPIDQDELGKALQKFKARFVAQKDEGNSQKTLPDLQALAKQLAQLTEVSKYKERFMVKVGDKIKSFEIAEVLAVYSQDKATYILTDTGRSYIIDNSVEEMSQALDPNKFFRVNRGFLVRHSAISEVSAHSNSRLRLVIKGMEAEAVIVARERTSAFKTWLDT